MTLPRFLRPAGFALMLTLLAAILASCLWIEVDAGVGTAWSFAQPGQANGGLLVLWFAYAACGPVWVLAATVRTRPQAAAIGRRILRIEKWGIAAALPLAVAGLFIAAGQTVI